MLPDVYYFNPTFEYAVANGNASWQPNRVLKQMESDLAVLPLFFSKPGDFILVQLQPSPEYIDSLKMIGIQNPNFITLEEAFSDRKFLQLPKGNLLPWGWSPAVHHHLAPLKNSCSEKFKTGPNLNWQNHIKELSNKKKASDICRIIINEIKSDFLKPARFISQTCYSVEEIEELYNLWGNLMVKAPWSSSGRGLQQVLKSPVHLPVKNRINGLIKEQGFVMVEPLFNKVFDLAFLFKSENEKISFIGISYFQTDSKGQYKGNYLNFKYENNFNDIIEFLKSTILPVLLKALHDNGYADYDGYFGVDTLIYKNRQRKLQINPCLEINLKYTMGLLSLYLEKFVSPSKNGMYKIYNNTEVSFSNFAEKMRETYPLQIIENRIDSGFFALTDSYKKTKFGAYLLVE